VSYVRTLYLDAIHVQMTRLVSSVLKDTIFHLIKLSVLAQLNIA